MYPNRNKNTNNIRKISSIIGAILIVLCGTQLAYLQIRVDPPEKEKVKGRVFARVNFFIYGSGLGPKADGFIYQIQPKQGDNNGKSQLVRVVYEFFDMKDRLPKTFFDFSKEYDLLLARSPYCDETPNNFGYQGTGETGQIKQSILRLMAGTDKELLQENQIMLCYTLTASDFVSK